MATTTGIVIRTLADGKADVAANKRGDCGSCSASHSCDTAKTAKKMATTVINTLGAEPGDLVAINVDTGQLLKGIALIYLLPVLGLLFGAVLGTNINQSVSLSETGSALLFGGIGLALGFGLVVVFSKLLAANDAYTPAISRIVKKGAVEPLIGDRPSGPFPGGCPLADP